MPPAWSRFILPRRRGGLLDFETACDAHATIGSRRPGKGQGSGDEGVELSSVAGQNGHVGMNGYHNGRAASQLRRRTAASSSSAAGGAANTEDSSPSAQASQEAYRVAVLYGDYVD